MLIIEKVMHVCVGGGVYRYSGSLCLSFNFVVYLKLFLKDTVYFKMELLQVNDNYI